MYIPSRLPENLARIVSSRSQRIREKFATLDAPHDAPPPDLLLRGILKDFDSATMSASFVISTQDMDRSGEIVDTAGIRTESHKLNPVVLWDHGRGPIARLPIGKCEDGEGQYTVVVRPQDGLALCRIFFSKTLPFARDVFALIGEGIIRGVSIGFRTIDAEPMPGYSVGDGDPPLYYREIELCEISPTPIPDNARALAIKVTKAFQGRRPSSEMLKALEAQGIQFEEKSMPQTDANKAKPKVLGKAFFTDLKALNESGRDLLSKAIAQITGKSADDYLAMDEDGKLDDETVADTAKDGMSTNSLSDGAAIAGPVDAVKDAGDDKPAYQQPLDGPAGQAAATDIHTQLGGVAEAIEGWAARQENERVKKLLDKLAGLVHSAMSEIEGLHDNEYDQHEPLGQTDEEKAAADTDAEKPDQESGAEDGQQETKCARQLGAKAPARLRHEKRLKAFRAKAAQVKGKLAAQAVSKSVSAVVTKAAEFLGKMEGHSGDWSASQKAASGFHAKSLAGLSKAPIAGDCIEGLDAKGWKERADKAQAVLEEAVKSAETATADAKRERAEKKKLLKAWNDFKKANGIN